MSAAACAPVPTARDYQVEAIADVRALAATVTNPAHRAALLALAQRTQASVEDATRLDALDELGGALLAQQVRIRDERRRLAILLTDRRYGRTTTPEDLHEDLADGAFSVALDAIQMALNTATNPERMALALRTALHETVNECVARPELAARDSREVRK